MNFVGHIQLARLHLSGASSPPDDLGGFLLGAALPDFAAMGRFRLTDRPQDHSVQAGVGLHHRTDEAFHAHPWFRRHSKAVSAELEQAGIGRGAARACGHVGVELLLDGLLLDDVAELRSAVETTTARTTDRELGLHAVVDPARRDDWQEHLQSVATWPLPRDYRSPAAVSERLRRILARRPRLAFDAEHVTLVADTLATHQPELEKGVEALVSELDATLAA